MLGATLALLLLMPAEAQDRAPRRQPIRLHPGNPHYFLFRGKATVLITSGEHYGAVLNPDFDFHRYLATLEADGLNYTRLFSGSYVEVPGESFGIRHNDLAPESGRFLAPWARSDVPGYAGGGNKFDLDRWDNNFFARLHEFLSDAAKRGILVEITLFSSHYGDAQWRLSPLNASNNVNGTDAIRWTNLHTPQNGNLLAHQERYTRRLVREVNAFDNVIFELENEPWSDRPELADVINPYLPLPARNTFPNSVDLPDALSVAWQTRLAEWIRDEESRLPNRHLIAQNYCNFRLPIRELIAGVDVVNFHYAYPEAALRNYGLGKAISYDETGFRGREDRAYRREAWNFLLSGGSVFDSLDYSFTAGHEDGSFSEPNGPGGGSAELRRQLHLLREFLNSFSLVELRPDALVVTQSPGVTARALSSAGQEYAIYLDGTGPAHLTLALPPGQYSAEWINVETGEINGREMFRNPRGEQQLTSPPFRDGMALRVKRVRTKAS